MFHQGAFQKTLIEVRELLPYIGLKLPANLASVRKQMNYLNQAETQLKQMQEKVVPLAQTKMNPFHKRYETLIVLIQALKQDIQDLKLLAEEYPIDPEGTISCLQSRKPKATALLNQFDVLKNSKFAGNDRSTMASVALNSRKLSH